MRQVNRTLEALGEEVSSESKDIAKERGGLLTLKSQTEVRLAQCRLLALRATDLEKKLQQSKKQIFTRDLFFHGPNIIEITKQSKLSTIDWLQTANDFFIKGSGLGSLLPWHVIPLFLLTGLGFLIGKRVEPFVAETGVKIERTGFSTPFSVH